MARKRAHNTDGTFTADDKATSEVDEAWVETPEVITETTPEPAAEVPVVEVEKTQPAPANIEVKSLTEEPVPAPAAVGKEEIETDVRKKLLSRSQEDDIFVPTSPAVLEAAAKQVAATEGFDLNRGTSIGARLMARSRKMV